MRLPFTVDQFMAVFAAYNSAIWPTQFLLGGIALLIVLSAFRERSSAVGAPALALVWGWSGVMYHLVFFRSINGAAVVFGLLFLAQAVALLAARSDTRIRLHFRPSLSGWVGAVLVLYALLIYPVVGYLLGHAYPAAPTFGAPCPVTIFTLGVLLWSERPLRWYVYTIPLAWAAVGTSAALMLGMLEDVGLAVAGVAFITVKLMTRGATRTPLSGWSVAR